MGGLRETGSLCDSLADVAGADVGAGADTVGALAVELVGVHESPEVYLQAVPHFGHVDGDRAVVAFHLRREDTLVGVGAVDEDEDLVVGGGRGDVEVGIEGDLHRTGGRWGEGRRRG